MSSNKWNKEFELNYFKNKVPTTNPEVYENELMRKFNFLKVKYNLSSLDPSDKFLDIGAGSYGGMLRFIPKAKEKIITDPLAKEFVGLGHLPSDISAIESYAEDLPFDNDHFDAVFSCESLDHVDSREIFDLAVKEMFRVTRSGGLVFFEMPIRPKAIQGHPISLQCITIKEIEDMFEELASEIIFTSHPNQSPQFGSPNPVIVVARK